jgi:hypothetical protein
LKVLVLLEGSDSNRWASYNWALSPEPSSSLLAVVFCCEVEALLDWKSEAVVPFRVADPLLNKFLVLVLVALVVTLVLNMLCVNVGLAWVLALSSVPLLEVKRLRELEFEKIPIPLNMFLSALNKLENGLMASLSFLSYLPSGSLFY